MKRQWKNIDSQLIRVTQIEQEGNHIMHKNKKYFHGHKCHKLQALQSVKWTQ